MTVRIVPAVVALAVAFALTGCAEEKKSSGPSQEAMKAQNGMMKSYEKNSGGGSKSGEPKAETKPTTK